MRETMGRVWGGEPESIVRHTLAHQRHRKKKAARFSFTCDLANVHQRALVRYRAFLQIGHGRRGQVGLESAQAHTSLVAARTD